jgi:molecular chaperone DnaK (HSP70)
LIFLSLLCRNAKEGDRIEVTYSLDESGIVVVKAKDHVSG